MNATDNKQMTQGALQTSNDSELVTDIRRMIEETREAVATTVNAGLTILYWRVGKRIREELLKGERAEYGKKILPTLSAKLVAECARGWREGSVMEALTELSLANIDTTLFKMTGMAL